MARKTIREWTISKLGSASIRKMMEAIGLQSRKFVTVGADLYEIEERDGKLWVCLPVEDLKRG